MKGYGRWRQGMTALHKPERGKTDEVGSGVVMVSGTGPFTVSETRVSESEYYVGSVQSDKEDG